MIPVPLFNTTINIPLFVLANTGQGIGGTHPVVWLSKNGSAWSKAQGTVIDIQNGGYWLQANQQDANTPGPVMIKMDVPSGDVAPFQGFFVELPNCGSNSVSAALLQQVLEALTQSNQYQRVLANSVLRNTEKFP